MCQQLSYVTVSHQCKTSAWRNWAGQGDHWEPSALSAQFFCKSNLLKKNNLLLKNEQRKKRQRLQNVTCNNSKVFSLFPSFEILNELHCENEIDKISALSFLLFLSCSLSN
jgi:hypothetical protein